MTDDWLSGLNESQRAAVTYSGGPALVIAGAGSGKTRVLTYKIAHLLEQGMMPWSILALTFTNKAAREMKERINVLVGNECAGGLWMGTFHSIFSRVLRMEADKLGFSSNFTIYDQSDSRNLVKSVIKEMGLDDKTYRPNVVASHISNAKNRLILPQAYLSDREIQRADQASRIPLTGEIYTRYAERCRQANVMDFDDLLLYTYLLFKNHPDVCRYYANKFEYVLVDEYQDTNYAQHCIVWELTKERQKVCVVGDDAQSIYSFRGANIDNILNFCSMYNNAKVFKLEQNYRSTQTIVSAANSLISHNNRQIPKDVFSEKEEGEKIKVYGAYSDIEEAEIVVKEVEVIRQRERLEYDDFAILYRTNVQSRTFEEAFRRRGLPYRIYGGLSFYQRKEIKDVIAYCRVVVNPHDEEAFKRIINYPTRGIGQTTLDKIALTASEHGVSLWDVVVNPLQYALSVNKGTIGKLETFTRLISGLTAKVETLDVGELIQEIIRESGMMREIYGDTTPEGMSRKENVEELVNGAQDFVRHRKEEGNGVHVGVADYLQEVSLLSDMDEDDSGESRKLTLMTVHSAKGLEFPVVFVVGLEEELFPSAMAGSSLREIEEERRLFYVALTRAEKHCILTFARSRFRFGKTEFGNPSRFLSEIDSRYLRFDHNTPALGRATPIHSNSKDGENRGFYKKNMVNPNRTATEGQTSVMLRVSGIKPLGRAVLSQKKEELQSSCIQKIPDSTNVKTEGNLQVGSRIIHERFGEGVVKALDGNGENAKATVDFMHTGTKQLLLRFARFRIVE